MNLTKRIAPLFAGVALIGALIALSSGTAQAATLGQSIANRALTQVTTDTDNDRVKDMGFKERRHNNCNPYGPCHAWCADFAKWVWKSAGAKVTGLNAAAKSFRDYGRANGTYRTSNTPKVGDAVIFNWDHDADIDHVSIVVKVTSTKIWTVGGNETDAVRYQDRSRSLRAIVGYVSPKPAR